MAGVRYFLGMTQADLEAALADARADLLAGVTLQTGGATDSNFSFLVQFSPQRRIELILEELSLIAPDTYPPDQVNPTRVTTGLFRDR